MAATILRFYIVTVVLVMSAASACAETVSSSELIEHGRALDKKTVSFRGEAISKTQARNGFSWMNLYDGDNAVGIYGSEELLRAVTIVGNYKHIGDTVRVEGIYHWSCPYHGGEMDIHARAIEVLTQGTAIDRPLSGKKLIVSLVFFLVTLAVVTKFKGKG